MANRKIRPLSANAKASIRTGVALTSFAQAVEELVLNSIDAGATSIAVRVDLPDCKIQVVDNGCGISYDQLSCVGERYSTSKCHTAEDLENLSFFGYRGEAIASLATASNLLEITSRTAHSRLTYSRQFLKATPQPLIQASVPRPSVGTTITAFDLFYNLPVRKMRLNVALEMESIRYRMSGLALMWPKISFSLRDDSVGNVILQTHKCSGTAAAFSNIFTPARARKLMEVDGISDDEFSFSGLVSTEGYSRKDLQYIFVNKRLVLRSALHKQVNKILKRSLILKKKGFGNEVAAKLPVVGWNNIDGSPTKQGDKYGIFVISLTCPYKSYDITFDPAKTLVEFRNWPKVIRLLQDMLYPFLRKHNLISSLDPDTPLIPENNDNTKTECSNNDADPKIDKHAKSSIENIYIASQLRYGCNINISETQNGILSKAVRRTRNMVGELFDTSCPSVGSNQIQFNRVKDCPELLETPRIVCMPQKSLDKPLHQNDVVKSSKTTAVMSKNNSVTLQNDKGQHCEKSKPYTSSFATNEESIRKADSGEDVILPKSVSRKVKFETDADELPFPHPYPPQKSCLDTGSGNTIKEITLGGAASGVYSSTLRNLRQQNASLGQGSKPEIYTNSLQKLRKSTQKALKELGDLYKTPERAINRRRSMDDGASREDCFHTTDNKIRIEPSVSTIKGSPLQSSFNTPERTTNRRRSSEECQRKAIGLPEIDELEGEGKSALTRESSTVLTESFITPQKVVNNRRNVEKFSNGGHQYCATEKQVRIEISESSSESSTTLEKLHKVFEKTVVKRNVETYRGIESDFPETIKHAKIEAPDLPLKSLSSEIEKHTNRLSYDTDTSETCSESSCFLDSMTKNKRSKQPENTHDCKNPPHHILKGVSKSENCYSSFDQKTKHVPHQQINSLEINKLSCCSQNPLRPDSSGTDRQFIGGVKSKSLLRPLTASNSVDIFQTPSTSARTGKSIVTSASEMTQKTKRKSAQSLSHSTKLAKLMKGEKLHQEKQEPHKNKANSFLHAFRFKPNARNIETQQSIEGMQDETNLEDNTHRLQHFTTLSDATSTYKSTQPHAEKQRLNVVQNQVQQEIDDQEILPTGNDAVSSSAQICCQLNNDKVLTKTDCINQHSCLSHCQSFNHNFHNQKSCPGYANCCLHCSSSDRIPFCQYKSPENTVQSSYEDCGPKLSVILSLPFNQESVKKNGDGKLLSRIKLSCQRGSSDNSSEFLNPCKYSDDLKTNTKILQRMNNSILECDGDASEDVSLENTRLSCSSQGFNVLADFTPSNFLLENTAASSSDGEPPPPVLLSQLEDHYQLSVDEQSSPPHLVSQGFILPDSTNNKILNKGIQGVESQLPNSNNQLIFGESAVSTENKQKNKYIDTATAVIDENNEQIRIVNSLSRGFSASINKTDLDNGFICLPGSSSDVYINVSIPEKKEIISNNLSPASLHTPDMSPNVYLEATDQRTSEESVVPGASDNENLVKELHNLKTNAPLEKTSLSLTDSPRSSISKAMSCYFKTSFENNHYLSTKHVLSHKNNSNICESQSSRTEQQVQHDNNPVIDSTRRKVESKYDDKVINEIKNSECIKEMESSSSDISANPNVGIHEYHSSCSEQNKKHVHPSTEHVLLSLSLSDNSKADVIPEKEDTQSDQHPQDEDEYPNNDEKHTSTQIPNLTLAQRSASTKDKQEYKAHPDSLLFLKQVLDLSSMPLELNSNQSSIQATKDLTPENIESIHVELQDIQPATTYKYINKEESILNWSDSEQFIAKKNSKSSNQTDKETSPSDPNIKDLVPLGGSESLFTESESLVNSNIQHVNSACSKSRGKGTVYFDKESCVYNDESGYNHGNDLLQKCAATVFVSKASTNEHICYKENNLNKNDSYETKGESTRRVEMSHKTRQSGATRNKTILESEIHSEKDMSEASNISEKSDAESVLDRREASVVKEQTVSCVTPNNDKGKGKWGALAIDEQIGKSKREPISISGLGATTNSLSLLRQHAKENRMSCSVTCYSSSTTQSLVASDFSATHKTFNHQTECGQRSFSDKMDQSHEPYHQESVRGKHDSNEAGIVNNRHISKGSNFYSSFASFANSGTLQSFMSSVQNGDKIIEKNGCVEEAGLVTPQEIENGAHLCLSPEKDDFALACWRQEIDTETGKKFYVNNMSGQTVSEDQWPDMSLQTLGDMINAAICTDNKSQQEEEEELAPLTASGRQAVTDVINSHIEEDNAEADMKWRGGRKLAYEKEAGIDVSTLLSKWSNPTFQAYKPPAMEAELCPSGGAAKSCFNSLGMMEFTKSMLDKVKVIGQVDNKFIACQIQHRNISHASPSSLLVLLDQHAVHERIRIEFYTKDCYESINDEKTNILTKGEVRPALILDFDEDDVRILRAFVKEFARIGVNFKIKSGSRTTVEINSAPKCLLDVTECGETKRKRVMSEKDRIECLIKEHIDLLKSTNGACGRLPLTVHKELCSMACRGAVKFGDSLTVSECKDLLSALSRCNLPFQCAHGRPSIAPLIDVTALQKESGTQSKRPRLWRLWSQRNSEDKT